MGENGIGHNIILIVDDEYEMRLALQDVLVREGYQVLTAATGKAAIEMMTKHSITLALLDLNMPGMTGLELMTEIRKRWPYTVVIILTGHGTLDSALVALRQGAHDYLLKPATPAILKESISRGLRKRYEALRHKRLLSHIEAGVRELAEADTNTDIDVPLAEPSSPQLTMSVKADSLIIDLQRHRVTLGEQDIVLTPTEFNTLLALVRNSGGVISYTELVEKTHGYTCSAQEAQMLIKTHISHLRKKIRQHTEGACPIVNLRGIGYMWELPNDS